MTKKNSLILIVALIIVGLGSRFFFLINGYPEIPNFTAIGAVALFGAYYLDKRNSIIIPLAILWVSDIVLNNMVYGEYFSSFSFFGDIWVYVGFIVTILVGWKLLKNLSAKNLIISSLLSALAFYVITNFSVWISSGLYPKTFTGLVDCYIKAIPFFRNAFLGNVFFSFILFGVHELVSRKKKILIWNIIFPKSNL